MNLFGVDLTVADFHKRFNHTVGIVSLVNGKRYVALVDGVNDNGNVRLVEYDSNVSEYTDSKSVPYGSILDFQSNIVAGFYITKFGSFGVSYTQQQQYRAGICKDRYQLFPNPNMEPDIIFAEIISNGIQATPNNLNETCTVNFKLCPEVPHCSGEDLKGLI